MVEISFILSFDLEKSKEKLEPIYVNSPLTATNFTFNLYRWSVACISTRINMIPSEMSKDDVGQPRLVRFLNY
ncbi:unnamed protein product [Brugia timori]|uniref:Uncharacterized protein n=1 Tax=Brugia timori TaxID=42155 RepID=A0A0R3R4D5_9BILA|nr:unnamed protein product [Brugia timori]